MTQEPFPKNVPPEEMYESSALREMAERLREGINRNELAILISEPGCGKNTLLRRLRHENSDTLFIYINGLNINTRKFYRDTLQQMGIDIGYYQADIKAVVKKQLGRFHSEGRKVCMVIDEAHVLRINLLYRARSLHTTRGGCSPRHPCRCARCQRNTLPFPATASVPLRW